MDRKTVREVLEEDRQRRTVRNRRRKMQLLAMTVCLVILVGVMYGGLTLYTRLNGRTQETMQGNVSGLTLDENGNVVGTDGPASSGSVSEDDDAEEAVSDSVVYSQEELDAKIAEAVVAAQAAGSGAVLDAIKLGLSDGDTVIETLRPFYPEEIIVASGGRYHFIPINRNLAQSRLLTENLSFLESGEVQYLEEGQVISHKGIDVSKHQGVIDWDLVAQDGVEFAFIRVANRGYTTGKLVEDEYFTANIEGAQAAGIKVGVYIYSQAVNEDEVLEEADLVLQMIAPYQLECPVVFDVERVSDPKGRMNALSAEERTNLTLLFCRTIENAGYTPMIYHNTEMGALMLNLEMLEDYDKWFAAYTDTLYFPYEYKIWQYSSTGHVQGISKEVDLNISFTPFWETAQ